MTISSTNNSVLRGFFEKQKLTGPNFIDWYRQLRIVLSIEDKLNYLEQPIPPAPIAPVEIRRNLKPLHAHEMLRELKNLFAQQAEQELLQTTRDFHSCRLEERQSVSSYVLKMKGYIDNLERLGHPVTLGLGVSLILIGLRKEYDDFVQNYNMHSMGKTVNELHAMLKLHEQTLPKSNAPALNVIRAGKVQKGNKHKKSQSQTAARGQNHRKGKNKQAYAPKPKIPPPSKRENPAKDSICHECCEIGHWKRNCPRYLAELLKKKKNAASGAGDNTIQVSKNNVVYFSAIPRDGIFKIDLSNSLTNEISTYVVSNKRAKLDLDSALLWHCRLGHISEKRIEKLQHDRLLDSSDLRAFEKCVSCMSFFEKQKLTGPNFIDWYRQLRIVLSIEDKLNYLEQPIPPAPIAPEGQQVAPEFLAAHAAWVKGSKEIAGLMLMSMEPEIQRNLEPLHAHEMLKELKTMFAQQAEQELLQTTRDFHSCKQEEGQSVSSHVLKMKGYIDNLERLGHPVTLGLGVSLILIGLRKEYDGFVQNYNMHSMGKTVNELHAMLKLHEQTLNLPKSISPTLHAIQAGKVQKSNKHKKSHSQKGAKGKNQGKGKFASKPKLDLDSALLWHCRLGHISKKRIEKLQ
nr:zinc finger, CCHC-type [Tanacetum cinerariifolium]